MIDQLTGEGVRERERAREREREKGGGGERQTDQTDRDSQVSSLMLTVYGISAISLRIHDS